MIARYIYFFISLGFFVTTGFVFAKQKASILQLLKEYEQAEIQKTREETLGKVYVFSREDIETLQLNTIADLIKLIPFGTAYPNNFGVIQWDISTEPATGIQAKVRIYLDGHEISSIHTLSPFLTYDEFPLDNIQKIEVYFSNSITDLSTENAAVTIKLYSKDPQKENVAIVKGLLDNKKGFSVTFSDARQLTRDMGYFILINKGYKKYDEIFSRFNTLDRDQKREHFYLKFNYIDTEIQISASHVNRGLLAGFSPDFSPDYGRMKSMDLFFSLSQKLLADRSLKLLVSYDWQERNYVERNSDYGVPFGKYIRNGTSPLYLDENSHYTKFILHISKIFKMGSHNLNTGFIYQDYQQSSKADTIVYPPNTVIKNYEPEYEEVDHFNSIYLKYKYLFNQNLKVFLEGKVSYYDWYTNKDRYAFDKKLGFVYKKKNLLAKTYVGETYFPPPLIIIEAKKENLKLLNFRQIYFQVDYNISENQKISGFIVNASGKNIFSPTSQGFISKKKRYENYIFNIGYNINFENISSEIEGWYVDPVNYNEASSPAGVDFIFKGKLNRINYFTAFLYRKGFKYQGIEVDDSYDLSLGAGYEFKNGFVLKLKGENIFNSSAKAVYIKPLASGTYKSFDRRFILTLEKVF